MHYVLWVYFQLTNLCRRQLSCQNILYSCIYRAIYQFAQYQGSCLFTWFSVQLGIGTSLRQLEKYYFTWISEMFSTSLGSSYPWIKGLYFAFQECSNSIQFSPCPRQLVPLLHWPTQCVLHWFTHWPSFNNRIKTNQWLLVPIVL